MDNGDEEGSIQHRGDRESNVLVLGGNDRYIKIFQLENPETTLGGGVRQTVCHTELQSVPLKKGGGELGL